MTLNPGKPCAFLHNNFISLKLGMRFCGRKLVLPPTSVRALPASPSTWSTRAKSFLHRAGKKRGKKSPPPAPDSGPSDAPSTRSELGFSATDDAASGLARRSGARHKSWWRSGGRQWQACTQMCANLQLVC